MPARWPTPTRVLEYYERSRTALSALKAALEQNPEVIDRRNPFFAMTPDEVETALEDMTAELNQQVIMLLSASAEATVRADFNERVRRRGKDPVSRRFRDLNRKAKGRRRGVGFEDILDAWKAGIHDKGINSAVSNVKKLFLYRHWLAHGRYWAENKSGLDNPDVYDAWKTLQRFINLLPGFDFLPPHR